MADDLSMRFADAAESDLRRQADGGDGDAALALGRRLLVGQDAVFAPDEGAFWVGSAARSGVLEAFALNALISAAGVGRPVDWNDAMDQLQLGAERGDDDARTQMRLLAHGAPDEYATPSEWRERIDIHAWAAPPARTSLCEAPRVRTISGFLPPEICRRIRSRMAGRLQRATMFNPRTGRDEPHPGRTNDLCVVGLLDADVVFALVRERIAAAVKIPSACFEPTQILRYKVGQEIAPHFDFLEGRNIQAYGSSEAYEGQRIATFLCYLNDDYEGGATTFPKVDISFRGRTGDALFFANVDGEGKPDRLSLHAGTPPTAGEKWTLSQWIHDRTFNGVLIPG